MLPDQNPSEGLQVDASHRLGAAGGVSEGLQLDTGYEKTDSEVLPLPEKKRRMCGMGVATFYLFMAMTAIAIAAIIGGAVGGSMAAKRHSNTCLPSSTSPAASQVAASTVTVTAKPSATSSTSNGVVLAASAEPPTPFSGCPDVNGTLQEASYGGKFLKYCDIDFHGNDLLGVMTNTFDYCIEACGSFNLQAHAGKSCVGVAFVPSWSRRNGTNGDYPANCILKSGGLGGVEPNPQFEVDSAKIQA